VKITALVHIDPHFWMRRRVLVTGHTGFKGAWLSLWLQSLGAEVTGVAPGVPTQPSLYELAHVGAHMHELAVDVRDAQAVRDALLQARPEVVLHLAAQPLVRRSLHEPALTYAVNVMGTVNVLEAVRHAGGHVRAIVIVTSDKCYENPHAAPREGASREGARQEGARQRGASDDEALQEGARQEGARREGARREGARRRFVESDPLGGSDPYSSSKACAELVAGAYGRSFFAGEASARLGTARAGNVIGGGDWGEDRLVPDAVRAVESGERLRVRNPHAVRPWQHVLGPLAGYLLLAQALARDEHAARAWNFGPHAQDARPVSWVVRRLAQLWRGELSWELDERANPPEAGHLELDSSAAERALDWRPALRLEDALELVVQWHRAHRDGEDMRAVSLSQIARI
jgi:CDP-glucose 4,6-dehydratase